MKNDPFVPSRRAGLAGAAALLLTPLSRPAGANATDQESVQCCGNGPPKVALYGVGMSAAPLNGNGTTVEFRNPFSGEAAHQLDQRQFIFVLNRQVDVVSYRNRDDEEVEPNKFKKVKGYPGVAFRVDEGFSLVLQWPEGDDIFYSARPLGEKE